MNDLGFVELLSAAQDAPAEKRGECVRRVRDAFLQNATALPPDQIELFDEVMTKVMDQTALLDRVTFAKAVARSPRLPDRLCRRLLGDTTMVAAPIIEHAAMSDTDLVRLIDPKNETVCLSVARRQPLSVDVADKLIAAGQPKVLVALARNVEAELSYAAFEILSDLAVEGAEMDDALSSRPDLPTEIARKLTRALERRTSRRLNAMIERDLEKGRKPFVLR
jgi:uncharacterized protein (DUF2336 family)